MSVLKRSLAVFLLAFMSFGAASMALAETDVTTSNSSDDTNTESGDAQSSNGSAAFVGQQAGGSTEADASDVDNDSATNVQEGDNTVEGSQSATSESGQAIGGQAIGANVDGDLTIDATNSSTDVDVSTGDADSTNDFAAFVGLSAASDTTIGADILNGSATNVQEGDNEGSVNQRTDAVTGDGIAGQLLGATSAGTATITLANTTEDADAASGDSTEESDSAIFSGLLATGEIDVF